MNYHKKRSFLYFIANFINIHTNITEKTLIAKSFYGVPMRKALSMGL